MTYRNALLELKRKLEDQHRARMNALAVLLDSLGELEKPPSLPLKVVTEPINQKRVRGVLAAVKSVIPLLPEIFDRNDVLHILKERNPELAAKMTLGNLRGTLRLLAKAGEIELHDEATSTRPARYATRKVA
jgi:hypothetical protein